MTLDQLIEQTGTKYHTDIFITKTLGFKPTQTENILRNNYNQAVATQIDNKFDGMADVDNQITLQDIYGNLFPDEDSFIDYVTAPPPARQHILTYIISRKADVTDKRKEVHELGLDEMRAILQAPNICYNPHYSERDKELAESEGKEYNVPEYITDYKAQNLKVSVFKHLDAQANKQIIHNQNIEIKIAHISKNPTLLGGNATNSILPHQRQRIAARTVNTGNTGNNGNNGNTGNTGNLKDDQKYQSPQEILDNIINNEETPDNIIDVTPMKAELMKQPEDVLIEKLNDLREQEKVAQHVPKAKIKATTSDKQAPTSVEDIF